MNEIIPRCQISIRPALAGDYAFIDRLQDMHSKALGFMPKAQLHGKIAAGHILIAEDEMRLPIGYCMSQDRYFKRDDVGIIYQMNVVPGAQRKLVGAMLLKAVFERAAYGCRLFCCWCAQDLDANYFWESMGFLPLAFRAGAKGKRAHIFWQRRIRQGDATTPYWFPAKTDGGHMREDRVVLPIPPGVHWKDPMPMLVPEVQGKSGLGILPEHSSGAMLNQGAAARRKCSGETPKPQLKPQLKPQARRRVQFGPPSVAPEPIVEKVKLGKPRKAKREKVKADPVLVAKARELRDRYLERFNSGSLQGGLPAGKYAVGRQIEASRTQPLLEAA